MLVCVSCRSGWAPRSLPLAVELRGECPRCGARLRSGASPAAEVRRLRVPLPVTPAPRPAAGP